MRWKLAINGIAAGALMVSAAAVTGLHGTPRVAQAAGTVSFGTWSSNPTEQAGQKKLVAAFEAKTGLHVDFQVLNGDYNAVLKTRMTAGTAPDVFYINSDHVQDFIRTNALKNLDFLAKDKSFGMNTFYHNLQYGFTFKGHTYALAKDYSTLALWYNKGLFKAAGIKSAPTTWTALAKDACKLTDKSKKQYGISLPADPARWLAFSQAMGGDLLNKQQTKATINTSGAKKALDWYVGLSKKGCAARPDQVGAGWDGEAFGRANAAMTVEGNWMTSYMQQTFPSVKWGVAELPKSLIGKRSNLAFTAGYAMYARTNNLKNATTLLKFLGSKQGEGVWAHAVGYLPSRKDVKPIAGGAVFSKAVRYSKDWFFPPGFADRALGPIGDDIRKVMDGSLSTSAAVKDMQDQANKALTQVP